MTLDLPELALSVRQPWAWAIIHGGKDVENRDWRRPNPGLAFRGRVAIHASSGMTRDEYDAIMPKSAPPLPPPHLLVRGAIIGHVMIMDIIRDPNRDTIKSPWFFGPVGLMLHDPVAIVPIPCSGALGFFKWRANLTDAVPPPAKWMLPKDACEAGRTPDQFVEILRRELRRRGIDGPGIASITVNKKTRARLNWLWKGKACSIILDQHFSRYMDGGDPMPSLSEAIDREFIG